MPALLPFQERVRFGEFDVDLRSGELRKRGIHVKLQVQPFQVLQILLERPGRVVTREELQKKIWPEDTFVDFDQGLNNAVKRLREALGDDAEKPRFIETLSKRGYRFIGPIQDERSESSPIGEVEGAAAEFAEDRADPTNKVEAPVGPGQVEVFASGQKTTVRSDGFARGVATGVLFSALVMAVSLFHGHSGQLGELLIQLGQRLAAKPSMHAVISSSALLPSPAPVAANPQQHAASSIRAQIHVAPLEKPSVLRVAAAAEARDAELGLPVTAAPSLTPTATPFAMAPVSYGLELAALVEPIELAQPGAVSESARDTRDTVPPYTDSSAGKYLDVGKFREALRANQVMDELGELGFYGVIVHNRTLWINSYHIMVGPYDNQQDLEAVRPALESRGFSPRVLSSRSTRFSLPPMTLYGTDMTIRDCIVTWELNSPQATVKFIKGRRVIATVRGRWEKRNFAATNDAVISLDQDHGPETLLEIQWRDTDKVLVLDGSPFRFYFSPS